MTRIPATDLDVFPLCLGGNVFGWTADAAASFAVLDAYVDAGGNFVDTADVYSRWVEGHSGGESERMIGEWLASRGIRDRMVIATKVGGNGGLGAANIRARVAESLENLRTDRIDLYYAHRDDPATPLEETLQAFDDLVRAGAVRHVAASNYTAPRLAEALRIADENGLARFVALQPKYNLVERGEYEGGLDELCVHEGLAVFPYSGLANGFLTGKYRPGADAVGERAGEAAKYLDDPRGCRVLDALDAVAGARGVPPALVALAWLAGRPGVVAPLSSARSPQQLAELLPFVELELDEGEIALLDRASR